MLFELLSIFGLGSFSHQLYYPKSTILQLSQAERRLPPSKRVLEVMWKPRGRLSCAPCRRTQSTPERLQDIENIFTSCVFTLALLTAAFALLWRAIVFYCVFPLTWLTDCTTFFLQGIPEIPRVRLSHKNTTLKIGAVKYEPSLLPEDTR